jgi:prolipoprotein diacylglyceryltransferase
LRADASGKLPAAWMQEGDLFKLFLAAYAVVRLVVEQVRGNPVMAFGLSGSQLMVLPAIAALAIYFGRAWRASRVALPAPSLT